MSRIIWPIGVEKAGLRLKFPFFNAKWEFLRPTLSDTFNLVTIKSIAIMKVNALFLWAKYRDYYDLYFLVKERLSLNKIFKLSRDVIFCFGFLFLRLFPLKHESCSCGKVKA